MASSASASGSSSRTYVDLTDDEFVGEIQARLRAELADNLKEMNRLRSQIRDLQSDNTVLLLELKETKDELKETRALLGQAVVTATRQKESSNVASRASTRSVPPPQPMRIRSPSIEVSDCAEKGKEKSTVEDTRPSTSKSTKCLSPNADVPPRNTAVKLEQSSTKRPLEVNPNAKKRPESSKRAKAEPVACAKEQSTSNSADTSGIQKAEGISHQAQGKAPIVPKPELKAEPKIILDLVSHHLHARRHCT
ncbi:hypothetical protein NLJ89_g4788 [Agrocybe chaxingu]|uniref:Uncharacterized protein n=1 Tax=Agrocybe chaxingu TaxID=84603 RepID=A0A9W8K240_9AGAR|nr:hypothetical protein NLJ89_g4788 [Agrocybe chaxingu]